LTSLLYSTHSATFAQQSLELAMAPRTFKRKYDGINGVIEIIEERADYIRPVTTMTLVATTTFSYAETMQQQ
jgi:hypothetical protein